MGVSLREMGDLEGALRAFAAGLAAVGEDPELRFQSALVLTALGRLEEARAQYLAMPTDVSGHFSSVDTGILGPKRAHNLGAVCLAMERYGEAREHLKAAISMGFGPAAHALFEAAMARDDLRTAGEALEGMRELEGPTESWAQRLAELAAARGESPDGAVLQAMRERPNAVGPRLWFARRRLEAGDEAAALPHLEMLDGQGIAEAAFYLGVCATRRGDLSRALEHMCRAQTLNPNHEPTREQVAALERAVEEGQRVALSPGKPESSRLLKGDHVGALGTAGCPVSVAVVTYNSSSTIEECASSVLQTLGKSDELVLVDNASTDGTQEILSGLAARDSRVRVLFNQENAGYARGMNRALLATKGEHLVMLNPDTRVFAGWTEGLRERIGEGVGAAGPVSNYVIGDQSVVRFLRPDHRPPVDALPRVLQETHRGTTRRVRFLAGFCIMVPRLILDRHGLLDESMELGADDLELSWRLRALGYRLAIAGDVFVRHAGSVSFGSLEPEHAKLRVRRSDEALIRKLRAYYGGKDLPSCHELWGNDMFARALALAETSNR
jgi:GT2 family glycosyltransferase